MCSPHTRRLGSCLFATGSWHRPSSRQRVSSRSTLQVTRPAASITLVSALGCCLLGACHSWSHKHDEPLPYRYTHALAGFVDADSGPLTYAWGVGSAPGLADVLALAPFNGAPASASPASTAQQRLAWLPQMHSFCSTCDSLDCLLCTAGSDAIRRVRLPDSTEKLMRFYSVVSGAGRAWAMRSCLRPGEANKRSAVRPIHTRT